MECLAVPKLPDGPEWVYEVKLDGYRAVKIDSKGKLSLALHRSRDESWDAFLGREFGRARYPRGLGETSMSSPISYMPPETAESAHHFVVFQSDHQNLAAVRPRES
jgi:hypothetical protein